MFATSVVYPVDRVGGSLAILLKLNPMTPIIDAYRSILLHGRIPDPMGFGVAAGVSVVLLLVSWVLFHRAEFEFAERI